MRARARATLIFALAVLLLGLQPLAALAAPANDDLGDATAVTQLPFYDTLDVSGATVADDEPLPWCAPIRNTVWYRIELSKKTGVVVDTAGSNFDTVLAVYDADLGLLACNDDMDDVQARLGFEASRRTTYYLQVGAYGYGDWDEEEGWFEPELADMELVLSIEAGKLAEVKPKPERYSFRGRFAEAWDWDDDGETWREAGAFVVDGRANRETIQELSLWSVEETYDPVKNVRTFTEWWGYGPITNAAIAKKLDSAYIEQPLELNGYSCSYIDHGDENGDDEEENGYHGFDLENGDENGCWPLGTEMVDVEMTWTGYGQLSRVRDHYSETGPWGSYRSHYNARSRDAFVTGGAMGDAVTIDLTGADGRLADVRFSDMYRPARR